MSDERIVANKITKPIQLLAAWLSGLAVINASFLTGAGTISSPSWIPALLAIAAVVNVPLFILSLFLLQTKFRPEMQEDTFYSEYLKRKYSPQPNAIVKPIDVEAQLRTLADSIVTKISNTTVNREQKVVEILKESELSSLINRFEDNRTLSELFLFKHKWTALVDKWENDASFKDSISSLLMAGLIVIPDNEPRRAELTELGRDVAKRLDSAERLWNYKHKNEDGREILKH